MKKENLIFLGYEVVVSPNRCYFLEIWLEAKSLGECRLDFVSSFNQFAKKYTKRN
jgi:hypothetical protein